MKIKKRKISASRKAMPAKRKVTAATLVDFTSDDFRRMLEGICDDIVSEWDPANGDVDDFIHSMLNDAIDRECTYYADCFNIIWASNVTDWSDADYQITTITSLAAWIIESEFYQEGYYDDVYERLTGGEDDEDEE